MLLLGGWTEWHGLSALPVPPLPDSMPRCRSLRFLGIRIQSPDPAFGSPALPIAKGSALPLSTSSPSQEPLDVPGSERGI